MGSSTDVIGPIAHSAYDAALVLEIMGGKDERDGTTVAIPLQKKLTDMRTLKVGVIKQHFGEGVQSSLAAKVKDSIELLAAQGATITEVSLPALELALPAYYVIVPAELSSNLARYDGIKYGHSAAATDLDSLYTQTRAEGFNDENIRRIMIGTYVLSSGYYDAYYRKAQTVRTVIINEFAKAFEDIDVLVGPTAPTTAFKLGENADDPLAMYMADVMTVGVSLAGLPAVSVPVGTVDNLPVGLQIIGPARQDMTVLSVADALMKASAA